MASKRKAKQGPREKAPKKTRRTNWEDLRRRFMAYEWTTLDEMAESIGVPRSTVYNHSAATSKGPCWGDARAELARLATGRNTELLVEDLAASQREMQLRHLGAAKELFFKAYRQLLSKVYDKKKKVLVEREFESESHALQAMRLAMQAEQSLLLKQTGPTNNFNGPTALLLAGGAGGVGNLNAQRALRELSIEDLQAIIEREPDGPGRASKAGGQGDAGAEGGARKRS